MEDDELEGTRWALEYLTLDGVSHLVSGRRIPELSFVEGELFADDGVNRGSGPYRCHDGRFSAGPIAATKQAYPDPARPEHDLFAHLVEVGEAVHHADFLHLRFSGGELVYRREEDAEEPA